MQTMKHFYIFLTCLIGNSVMLGMNLQAGSWFTIFSAAGVIVSLKLVVFETLKLRWDGVIRIKGGELRIVADNGPETFVPYKKQGDK